MRIFYLLLLIMAFSSCEVKVNKENEKSGKETNTYSRNNSKIRNGIDVKTTGGVEVTQAFLTYEDGSFVSEENITELKRPLKLRLVVEGWKPVDGKVHLEGDQIVTTNSGQEVIALRNLFSSNNIDAVSEEDAKFINLDVVVNNINMLIDYFKVDFHVWNTKEQQSIKGSYKFHINEM